MDQEFGQGPSNAEIAFAHRVHNAGFASFSQAIKDLQLAHEGEEYAIARVDAWTKRLAGLVAKRAIITPNRNMSDTARCVFARKVSHAMLLSGELMDTNAWQHVRFSLEEGILEWSVCFDCGWPQIDETPTLVIKQSSPIA